MYYGGGHLGFPIGIKNVKFVENLPMIIQFKMAATEGLSLTLDPMGKMFQNASSLKRLGQLKPNCPGMIIGRFSTNFMFFMPIGNPFEFHIGTKNVKFVEDHPTNIHVQFGFNNICSF
jgi:hypothetical protein